MSHLDLAAATAAANPRTHLVLGDKQHPLGGFFLAQDERGFLAGRDRLHVSVFATARKAYDYYRPMADTGHHWAWNLCYLLEDLL